MYERAKSVKVQRFLFTATPYFADRPDIQGIVHARTRKQAIEIIQARILVNDIEAREHGWRDIQLRPLESRLNRTIRLTHE